MKIPTARIFAVVCTALVGASVDVAAQQAPDIGFVSVGRAAPLADDINDRHPSAPPCSAMAPSSARPARGRRRRASSRCHATSSPRRTSTPTARCGVTRDTSAATARSPSRTCGPAPPAARSARIRPPPRPGVIAIGTTRASPSSAPTPSARRRRTTRPCSRKPAGAADPPCTRPRRCRTNGTASIASPASVRATTTGSPCATCRCRRCCRC